MGQQKQRRRGVSPLLLGQSSCGCNGASFVVDLSLPFPPPPLNGSCTACMGDRSYLGGILNGRHSLNQSSHW
jgi:hypothetical protein